jgi:predicted ATP-dependent serine protease
VKNRFGSTDELGVFEMSGYGLQPVLNPTEMFLTEHDLDSEILAGLAVAVVLDGSRTFAIEVQVHYDCQCPFEFAKLFFSYHIYYSLIIILP